MVIRFPFFIRSRCPFCEIGIVKVKVVRGPVKGRFYHPFRSGHPAMKKAEQLGVNTRRPHAPCLAGRRYAYIMQGRIILPIQPFGELLDKIDHWRRT